MITVDIAALRPTAKGKKERRIEKPLDAGHTISTLRLSCWHSGSTPSEPSALACG
jgi:hypothetical protein